MKLPKLKMNFYEAKAKFNKSPDYRNYTDISGNNPIIGTLFWTNPPNVLWLYATDNEEDYEGHQTQFGIDEQGNIYWAYYSHCSCNGYSDKDDTTNLFKEEDWKCYELTDVSKEVFTIMADRIRKLNKVKANE